MSRDYRSITTPPVNVTPAGVGGSTNPPLTGASGGGRWSGDDASGADSRNHDWGVWSWAGGNAEGRGGVSWLGLFLVLIGVALFVNQLNRSIDVGSRSVLALGLAFGAAWLIGGWRSATVPALVLVALGVAGLAGSLGYVNGPGWTSLALGIAFVAAWVIGYAQRRRRMWALWIGLILGIYGILRVSPQLLPGLPDTPWLWPIVLIVIGVLLLMRRRMDDRGTGRRF
jgi:hypothetical protein